jgi:hypothetical protein
MSSLAAFLQHLLSEGEAVLRERPEAKTAGDATARDVLDRAYQTYLLEIAGTPIPFDAETAVLAAECVRQSCWYLMRHDEPEEELTRRLVMSGHPNSAAEHLSADLMLRFLPQIRQRARALAADDPLPALLADILRRWPLSGVLGDLPDGPARAIDFHGHRGLMLLYAERLVDHAKPAWLPEGEALQYVELIFQQQGRNLTSLYQEAQATAAAKGKYGDDDA